MDKVNCLNEEEKILFKKIKFWDYEEANQKTKQELKALLSKISKYNQLVIQIRLKIYLLLTNQKFISLERNLVTHKTRNRNKGGENLEHKINTPKNKCYSNGRLGDEFINVQNRK